MPTVKRSHQTIKPLFHAIRHLRGRIYAEAWLQTFDGCSLDEVRANQEAQHG